MVQSPSDEEAPGEKKDATLPHHACPYRTLFAPRADPLVVGLSNKARAAQTSFSLHLSWSIESKGRQGAPRFAAAFHHSAVRCRDMFKPYKKMSHVFLSQFRKCGKRVHQTSLFSVTSASRRKDWFTISGPVNVILIISRIFDTLWSAFCRMLTRTYINTAPRMKHCVLL